MALNPGGLIFGVTATGTGLMCTNFSTNHAADEATAKDESGITKAVEVYDKREEVSFDGYIKTGYTIPSVGDEITLGGIAYVIRTIAHTQTNTDFQKCSITCVRWVDGGIPASGSGGGE